MLNLPHARKWTIHISGGLFGRRLSTKLALEALSKLDTQLMLYGPANVEFVVGTRILNGKGGIGFERLVPKSASMPVANEKRLLQAG